MKPVVGARVELSDLPLREEQVAVMPGSSFGEQAESFIRLSLTVPDAHIDEACRRIAALAARSASPKERCA